jgi:hypothetical protein
LRQNNKTKVLEVSGREQMRLQSTPVAAGVVNLPPIFVCEMVLPLCAQFF